jgi:hypothetical protein
LAHVGPATRWRWIGCSVLALFAALVSREWRTLTASTVGWSEFDRDGSIYFAPALSQAQRAEFRASLAVATERVAEFYGPLRGKPTIIVTDEATAGRFTDVSTGITHYQPTGAMIVLGPKGRSVDVLAHELAHAELFVRVGYRALAWCVPTWFDEGLAVQFDERPWYSPEAFEQRRRSGWRMPALEELASKDTFFDGSRDEVRFRYAGARIILHQWVDAMGKRNARQRIDSIGCDDATKRELQNIAKSAP